MSKGLKCPLCGSWYSTAPETRELGLLFKPGDICGNRAMTGPNPQMCSSQHPCQGRLVPVEDEDDGDD
jgi:hypothetical protein